MRPRHQMQDDLGIGGGLHQAAGFHQRLPQPGSVGEVAIMAKGKTAKGEFREKRLDIACLRLAGGGIAVMPDGSVAFQPLQMTRCGIKVFTDMADPPVMVEFRAIGADDPRCLLTPMLKGVKPERCQDRCLLNPEDAEDCAFIIKSIRLGREV